MVGGEPTLVSTMTTNPPISRIIGISQTPPSPLTKVAVIEYCDRYCQNRPCDVSGVQDFMSANYISLNYVFIFLFMGIHSEFVCIIST